MKTQKEILQDLITDTIAGQDKITFFGKSGAYRALLSAMSHVDAEIWNDVVQTKRQMQVDIAAGSDLDTLAERTGLTRLGATKSSCIIIVNGTAGTVIPVGSTLTSTVSGSQYATVSAITLGENNPELVRPIGANSLGDTVIVESITTGSGTQIGVNELTAFDNPITGVDNVTNLVPSTGGNDNETDDELRERIKQQSDLLNQGTQAFYEAAAKTAESTVYAAKAGMREYGGVNVYLLKNDFAFYTNDELDAIAYSIYDGQRAFLPVTCLNAGRRSIEVKCFAYITPGYQALSVFANIAGEIANLISDKLAFGATIKYQDVLTAILSATGVQGVDLSKFLVNDDIADIRCGEFEVPVFTYLAIDNLLENINATITQSYLII